MSELEKVRAISFLSILAITLIVLFAMQSRTVATVSPADEALQLCATSKGALCPEEALPAVRSVVRDRRVAPIASALQPTPRALLIARDAPVLGAITVTASRLRDINLAVGAQREGVLYLARAR